MLDARRDQVRTRRDQLSELHERGSEFFEGEAELARKRAGRVNRSVSKTRGGRVPSGRRGSSSDDRGHPQASSKCRGPALWDLTKRESITHPRLAELNNGRRHEAISESLNDDAC